YEGLDGLNLHLFKRCGAPRPPDCCKWNLRAVVSGVSVVLVKLAHAIADECGWPIGRSRPTERSAKAASECLLVFRRRLPAIEIKRIIARLIGVAAGRREMESSVTAGRGIERKGPPDVRKVDVVENVRLDRNAEVLRGEPIECPDAAVITEEVVRTFDCDDGGGAGRPDDTLAQRKLLKREGVGVVADLGVHLPQILRHVDVRAQVAETSRR